MCFTHGYINLVSESVFEIYLMESEWLLNGGETEIKDGLFQLKLVSDMEGNAFYKWENTY